MPERLEPGIVRRNFDSEGREVMTLSNYLLVDLLSALMGDHRELNVRWFCSLKSIRDLIGVQESQIEEVTTDGRFRGFSSRSSIWLEGGSYVLTKGTIRLRDTSGMAPGVRYTLQTTESRDRIRAIRDEAKRRPGATGSIFFG